NIKNKLLSSLIKLKIQLNIKKNDLLKIYRITIKEQEYNPVPVSLFICLKIRIFPSAIISNTNI
ncbi:hypothetical protein, partial [Bacillus cereus]|uniref:hypothetical protein n=1 Tax=Bacillus cereus TaxID=1396 RepID=UPI001F24D677